MLVLSDDLPLFEKPWLTYAVIAVCVVAFVIQSIAPYGGVALVLKFGCVPAIVSGQLSYGGDFGHMHGLLTLLTCAFLHGSVGHLFGNMLFLLTFGKNVEESFGRVIYAVFIVLCAIASSLAQVVFNSASTIPEIGASGFISGIMGAYLVMFPMAMLTIPFAGLLPVTGRFTARLPAFLVLGMWIVQQGIQLHDSHLSPGNGPNIAYWAHMGGFFSGIVGGIFLRWLGLAATYQPDVAVQ